MAKGKILRFPALQKSVNLFIEEQKKNKRCRVSEIQARKQKSRRDKTTGTQ